jgi:glycosyltransferase involved in cell wall biosynthesis
MPGCIDHEYFWNPEIHLKKSLPEIYRDMDGATDEVQSLDPTDYDKLDSWVLIPPMHYDGKLVKGLFVSPTVDIFLHCRPELSELFFTAVTPRWSGYPWSRKADIIFCGFDNPPREAWFREAYPERSHQLVLPFEHEVDFINEYYVAPNWAYTERDIDVVMVSRFSVQKNIPMMVEAGMIYRNKYNKPLFHMALIIGKDLNGPLTEEDKKYLQETQDVLDRHHGHIEMVGHCSYNDQLFNYYRHAKVFALGSLLEGKNRAQREALYCNTPVAMFEACNQYARGGARWFPEECGLMVQDFDAEAMADTWHAMICNQEAFTPRKSILRRHGRKRYVNQLMSQIPYYAETIPDFNPEAGFNNLWVDLAIQANYQMTPHQFLYSHRPENSFFPTLQRGLEGIEHYLELFNIPFKATELLTSEMKMS